LIICRGGIMPKLKRKVMVKAIVPSRQSVSQDWVEELGDRIQYVGQEYMSVSDAARELKVGRTHILANLSGKVPHVRGFVFKRCP
tara:strand:- start:4062 stop:4316 length:255 start_codon:yes stop_codon:yes gene_type:complete